MDKDYDPQQHRAPNRNEMIIYRLDNIDKSIAELKEVVTQTALQEQRITTLELSLKAQNAKLEDYAILKEKIAELTEAKKNNNNRGWQILLLVLSPIVSAIVVYALAGGFTK